MKELTFLVVIILIGLAGYLLYASGVLNDVFNRLSKLFEGVKLPKIKISNFSTKQDRDLRIENEKIGDYHRRFQDKINEYKLRASSKGDKINKQELDYLWDGISTRRRVPCFTCKSADMYSGVQTGNSQYWYCPNCGQVIILSIITPKKEGVVCYNLGIDNSKIK